MSISPSKEWRLVEVEMVRRETKKKKKNTTDDGAKDIVDQVSPPHEHNCARRGDKGSSWQKYEY